jgi:radical SAM superfamily enzyme YgiQ (UPF0313 family)
MNITFGDLKFYNKYSRHEMYVPLNLGYLVSHLQKKFNNQITVSMYIDPQELILSVCNSKPDLLCLSLYTWNTNLTNTVTRLIREKLGCGIVIIAGGPSIDIDHEEQQRSLSKMSAIDAFVIGEGEVGLQNIIERIMSDKHQWNHTPIDGVVIKDGNEFIRSKQKVAVPDLSELDSPYLNGILDKFLRPPFRPIVQASRGCPNTCTFCVSGKNPPVLRHFPVEQVKNEMTYLAKKLKDIQCHDIFIVDENFGIFPTDVEIADHIVKLNEEVGSLLTVSFYNDKKFTPTSREICEKLKNLRGEYGISLQTENEETLRRIKRKNLDNKQIDEIIQWARDLGISTNTELIFGLPYETLKSFMALMEKSIKLGFDRIVTNPLFLLSGAELNRREARAEFGLKTQKRLFMNNYGLVEGVFSAESEEVVVSSSTFTFDDFMTVRYVSFMFYAVYTLNFYRLFFYQLTYASVPITQLFVDFFHPDPAEQWPDGYLVFLSDLKDAMCGELYDNEEDLLEDIERKYRENGCEVLPPTKINVTFGARLLYLDSGWFPKVIKRILDKYTDKTQPEAQSEIVDLLLKLHDYQLIRPDASMCANKTLHISYDIVAWGKDGYRKSLNEYVMHKPKTMEFFMTPMIKNIFESVMEKCSALNDFDSCYAIIEQVCDRAKLYYSSRYKEQ